MAVDVILRMKDVNRSDGRIVVQSLSSFWEEESRSMERRDVVESKLCRNGKE